MDTHVGRAERRKTRGAAVVSTDPLLDPEAAAAYLGLAPKTLSNWRGTRHPDRSIAYVKVGGLIRYRKSALDRFLHRNEHDVERGE